MTTRRAPAPGGTAERSAPDLPDYAAVTPVRDEAEHLPLMVESMLAQTHPPLRWVIVDDGSRDATRSIAEAAAERVPWISVVGSEPAGDRARGAPVVRAFKRGLAEVGESYEFVTKLDADLFLPAHYFEWVARTFAHEPRAGIVGGRVLVHDGHEWGPERVGRHTVHGAVKSYRRSCLEAIGGLHASMGWDGIDEYAAKARDWRVMPLSELHVLHYARRGSKQAWWKARLEEGRGAHFMGYLPRFVLVRAAYRMAVEEPRIAGGLVLAAGFLKSLLTRAPRVDDPLAIEMVRREQRDRLRRLLRGGGVAPDIASDGGPSFWAQELARHDDAGT
jgi:poly-beta-1,6-N-acetyl-D-glucosamine synthase